MKTSIIVVIAGASLLPFTAFAQTPPTPPSPPVPPAPPAPPSFSGHDHDRGPKTPVTWLGVETSEVPRVVSEQLGLAKGFGLVVDYVVPDGPAAAAGVQQNDILKMLNDQILTEPDQLAKLIRSYSEGTTVTLTVLRKGAEQKLTVKLAKHDVSMHTGMLGPNLGKDWMNGHDLGALGPQMEKMKEQLRENLGHIDMDSIRDTVREARREAMRAGREARRRARELRVVSKDAGALKSTRIDVGKAQIVFSDAQGEMKLEKVDGKKVLTAKDPQGKLLFSGPVETKEDLDKLPPDVRLRYDKLEHNDLPSVSSGSTFSFSTDSDDEDNDNDADDEDNDNDNDDSDSARAAAEQVSFTGFPRRAWTIHSVVI